MTLLILPCNLSLKEHIVVPQFGIKHNLQFIVEMLPKKQFYKYG
jgi:hypothetical protein